MQRGEITRLFAFIGVLAGVAGIGRGLQTASVPEFLPWLIPCEAHINAFGFGLILIAPILLVFVLIAWFFGPYLPRLAALWSWVIWLALLPARGVSWLWRMVTNLYERILWWAAQPLVRQLRGEIDEKLRLEGVLRSEFSQAIDEVEGGLTAVEAQAAGPYGFRPVWIGGFTNDVLEGIYYGLIPGRLLMGGVFFEIPIGDVSRNKFNMINWGCTRDETIRLPQGVSGVRAVYVLINSNNTFERDRGKLIGKIELQFDAANTVSVNLVVGENIREWCIGHPGTLATVTDRNSVEVWRGSSIRGGRVDAVAVIDMLKIEVPERYRNKELAAIRIVDKSPGRQHLVISGITCLVSI